MGVRDPQTEWMRVQAYRRMSGEQRIALAAEMYEDGVAIRYSTVNCRTHWRYTRFKSPIWTRITWLGGLSGWE
jgi:hypothetical protein